MSSVQATHLSAHADGIVLKQNAVVPNAPTIGRGPVTIDLSNAPPISYMHAINIALHKAVEVDSSIKDFLIHQDEPIWVTCARGTIRLSEVITGCPELEGPMTKEAITYFCIVYLMGAKTQPQAIENRERLSETMRTQTSYSDSIRLNWGAKIRISLFRHGRGKWALVGRVSSTLVARLDALGLPHQAVAAIRSQHRGLVLITGPISAGKTATAQAILNHRNLSQSGHIMTIEDPVETSLIPEKCMITTKEVGIDVASFQEGMRDALRQAVDVLLIGELRDPETIKTALSAAGSGMMVIATVHGDSCFGAINRMMSLLGEEAPGYWKVLGSNLVAVVRQALVPTLNGDGWQMAADAMINTGSVSQLLGTADGKGLETLTNGTSKGNDWISMNDGLKTLIKAKRVSLESALRATTDVKGLGQWAQENGVR